jgi:bifunctional DNase/RNase
MPDDPEDREEPDNLDEPPSFFRFDGEEPEREEVSYGDPVEVTVEGVYQAETGNKVAQFVVLTDGTRKLPIAIGPFEAQSIAMALEGERPDRPITHDFIKNLLERLGVTVDRVLIDDLWSDVFYAKLVLHTEKGEIEVDVRPSDAIAVGLRCNAPIFVLEGILDSGFP